MTVKELRDKLYKYDDDAQLAFCDTDKMYSEAFPLDGIYEMASTNTIVLVMLAEF